MIELSAEALGRVPSVDGVERESGTVRFDPAAHRAFVEAATGIDPAGDLSPAECYLIGNRLEALVDERTRTGEWETGTAPAPDHPGIESLTDVVGLARLFRAYHAEHVAAGGYVADVEHGPGDGTDETSGS